VKSPLSILKLWHFLTRIGVDKTVSHSDAKFIINVNASVLIAELVTFPYLVLYPVFEVRVPPWMAFCIIFIILAHPITIVLNKHKKFLLAKLYFMLLGGCQLFLISLLLSKEAGIDYYILAALILPFFIFRPQEKGYIVLVVTVLIAMFFTIQYLYSVTEPLLFMEKEKMAAFYNISTSMIMFWLVFQAYYFYKVNQNAEAALEEEKEKSDRLLLNILPFDVAQELKQKGAFKPRHFQNVSVLFTDFQGFTKIAEKMSPTELVRELDRCFSFFDSIMGKYNLEKLKTIGDGYMCAGGLPLRNNTHAIDIVMAAIDIQQFMQLTKAKRVSKKQPHWEIRVGIHSGHLVAGVIGNKKFAYDVWGDTVNTASRIESAGQKGKINISGATYELVKDFFECRHRGKIKAKNKGSIDMYFVNQIRPQLAKARNLPNGKFVEMYQVL